MPHRLTQPSPPDAWLLLLVRGDQLLVNGIFDAPDHPELLAEEASGKSFGNQTRIVRDDPSLAVLHHGFYLSTPASLRARDNWFLRYQSKLEPYLDTPRIAQAFTYSPGKLVDPLSSFKAKPGGPCPLPVGVPWPSCGYCQTAMVMVGVLDFRQAEDPTVPRGSLVLHGCPQCGLCADEETWAVNWLLEGEPFTLHGDPTATVEVGARWRITEYPTPNFEEIRRLFEPTGERAAYRNFSSTFDKVGGYDNWIQGDDEFKDSPYAFIGQLTGEDDSLRGWDTPVVYLLHDPATGHTIASLQSF